MTSVAVWREQEGPPDEVGSDTIWVGSDSRVSTPDLVVLSERVPKILPLTLSCFEDGRPTEMRRPIYQDQLGFAFSGSTLAATATLVVASACLSELQVTEERGLPSLDDIAAAVGRIATLHTFGPERVFEAFVVGVCPRTSALEAKRLSFSEEKGEMVSQSVLLPDCDSFELLGSHKEEIAERIRAVQKMEGAERQSGRWKTRSAETT